MTQFWRLEGAPLAASAEPGLVEYSTFLLGAYSKLLVDPDRYAAMLFGYDASASAWSDDFRRRVCNTAPPLELAAGVKPEGAIAGLAGLTLVSAALRKVLESAGCDAAFAPVVGTGVGPGDWFTLWVRSFADPVDHARTPGCTAPLEMPDGFTAATWQRALPSLGEWPVLTYYRVDFTPPTPMFRCAGTGWTIVSDELADELLRSGLPGIELQDVITERGQTERVLKTP